MRRFSHEAVNTSWHPVLWVGLIMMLSVPAFAMIGTNEVDWTATDFGVGAILLGMFGGGVELAMRTSRRWRLPLAVAALAIVLAIWIELAVGVFGTPFAGT